MSDKERGGKPSRGGGSTRGKRGDDRGGSSATGYRGGRGGQSQRSERSDRPQYVAKDTAPGTQGSQTRGREEESKDTQGSDGKGNGDNRQQQQRQGSKQRYQSKGRQPSKDRRGGTQNQPTAKPAAKYIAKKKTNEAKFTHEELLAIFVEIPQKNELFEAAFIAQKAALEVISFNALKPETQSEFKLDRNECTVQPFHQKRGTGHRKGSFHRKFSDENPDWIDEKSDIYETNFDFGKKQLVRGESNQANQVVKSSAIEDEDSRQNKLFEELQALQAARTQKFEDDKQTEAKNVAAKQNITSDDLMSMFQGMKGAVGTQQTSNISNAIDVDQIEKQQEIDFSKIDEQFEEKVKGQMQPKKTTLIGIEEESDDEDDGDEWEMPDDQEDPDQVGWGLKKPQDKEVLKVIENQQKKQKLQEPKPQEQKALGTKVLQKPTAFMSSSIEDPAIMGAQLAKPKDQPKVQSKDQHKSKAKELPVDPAIMQADPAIIQLNNQIVDPAIMSAQSNAQKKEEPKPQPQKVQIQELSDKEDDDESDAKKPAQEDDYSINPLQSLSSKAKSFVPKHRKSSAAAPNAIPEASLSLYSIQNYKRTSCEKRAEEIIDNLFAQEMPGFQTIWSNETFNSVLSGSDNLNIQLDPFQLFLVQQNPFSSILMRKDEKRLWYWRGSYGGGPFTSTQMYAWYKDGYLRPNSIIKLGDSSFFKIKDLLDFANGRRTAPQRLAQMSNFAPTNRYPNQQMYQDPDSIQQIDPAIMSAQAEQKNDGSQAVNAKLESLFTGSQPGDQIQIDESKMKTIDEIENDHMNQGPLPPMHPNPAMMGGLMPTQMTMGGPQARGPWGHEPQPGGQGFGGAFGGGQYGGFMSAPQQMGMPHSAQFQNPMGMPGGPQGFGVPQGFGGPQMMGFPGGQPGQPGQPGPPGQQQINLGPEEMSQLQSMMAMTLQQQLQPGGGGEMGQQDMGQMESMLKSMLGMQGGNKQ